MSLDKIRTIVQTSTDPAPQYVLHRFDGIKFHQDFYPVGSWQTMNYPNPIAYNSPYICQVQLSGEMAEPTGVWPARVGGWVSREDEFVIPAGTWKRETTQEAELWCCNGVFGLFQEDLSYMSILRLKAGDSFELNKDDNLLIVHGEVEIDGVKYERVKRIKAASGQKSVSVEADGFAFKWNTNDVPQK